MTNEQMRDLVKECGLDWQRGYMPLFDGDPTNRYAVLIEAAVAAERERCAKACEDIDARCPECAGHNDHDQCVVPAPWQYAAAIRMRSQFEAENLNKGTI